MSPLPPPEIPLNQHSLIALEEWLNQLGAEKTAKDPCRWTWMVSNWSAEIQIEQDELRVTWEHEGARSQCCFPYGLPRGDVEEAMKKWLWRYRSGGEFAKDIKN